MDLSGFVKDRQAKEVEVGTKDAEFTQMITDYMDVGAKLAEGFFGTEVKVAMPAAAAGPVVRAASSGIRGILRKSAPVAAAAGVAGGAGYAAGTEMGREKEVMEQRRRTVLDRMFPAPSGGGESYVIDEHSPWG